MKRVLAIGIFLVGFCVLSNRAHAESNPLLTVFEVIKTGTNATLAKYVSYAVYGYENCKNACSISSESRDTTNGKIIFSWTWIDNSFESMRIKKPTATLEVEVNYKPERKVAYEQPVLSVTYRYEFLNSEKLLTK